jgi:hypothetical protein
MLILWQVSVIGERLYSKETPPRRLSVLVDYLQHWYDPEHLVTLYEASPYPIVEASIQNHTLERLPQVEPAPLATLYVPPVDERQEDAAMAALLGVPSG